MHQDIIALLKKAQQLRAVAVSREMEETSGFIVNEMAPAIDRASSIPDEDLSEEEAAIISQVFLASMSIAFGFSTKLNADDADRVTNAFKALFGESEV